MAARCGSLWNWGFGARLLSFGDTTGSNWILLINTGLSVALLLQVNVHLHTHCKFNFHCQSESLPPSQNGALINRQNIAFEITGVNHRTPLMAWEGEQRLPTCGVMSGGCLETRRWAQLLTPSSVCINFEGHPSSLLLKRGLSILHSSMEPHPCPALGLHIPTMALQVGGVAQVLLSPWTAELGAVLQGTQKAVWDVNLSLGGLMNDTGLLLWQGTSPGSAVTKQLLNRFLSSQCFCGCHWHSEDALGNFQFW